MRNCFIHIGTHKTGTTSLQKSLLRNRQAFLTQGLLYPEVGMLPEHEAHHSIASELGAERFSGVVISEILATLENCDKTIILSSEHFSGVADKLPWFLQRIRELGIKPIVICYVRDQISYARSLYLELLHHGYKEGAGAFVNLILRDGSIKWFDSTYLFNFQELISLFSDYAEIIVRQWRPYATISDFWEVLGLLNAPSGDEHMNTSAPLSHAIAAFFNNHLETPLTIQGDFRFLDALNRACSELRLDFTSRTKILLHERFSNTNDWMDRTFNLSLNAQMQTSTDEGTGDFEGTFSEGTLALLTAFRPIASGYDAALRKLNSA